jgi:hypothetical protein
MDARQLLEDELAALVPLDTDRRGHGRTDLRRALETANFVDRHLDPQDGVRPGLRDGGLPADTAPRLRRLVAQIEQVGADLAGAPPRPDLFLLRIAARKLRVLLHHVGGDASVDPSLSAPRDAPTWIAHLAALADLAAPHAARLREIPAFPATLVDDVRALVAAYDPEAQARAAALRDRRVRLAVLLHRTIAAVHGAADAAFRCHPRLALAARLVHARHAS